MIVIPAVDVRDGKCVQLVGGSYDNEKVRLENPLSAAERWEAEGFRQLHIVDLDAATGRGSNGAIIQELLEASNVKTQVGGGVRSDEEVDRLMAAGAGRIVVGTRALEDSKWLEQIAARYPARIIAAVDVHDGNVMTRGWTSTLDRMIDDVVTMLNEVPLAGLLVTAVHAEGRMQGTDLHLMENVVRLSKLPVQASGGVGSISDLRSLNALGVAATIVGMALYTGALDARTILEEFPQ